MTGEPTMNGVIEAFKTTSTAVISDNLERLPGAMGLRPFHKGGTMVGTALTVKTRAGDNLIVHRALELVHPGNVVVIDGEGDVTRALIGEIIVSIAMSRGAVGFVVNGAIRDVRTISEMDFPCFAAGVTHRGPYKHGPGQINVPVAIGGMLVQPGDIVVGDGDGVVAFARDGAAALLNLVQAQQRKENEILQRIRAGHYHDGYAKA
jgi:RraA family protein